MWRARKMLWYRYHSCSREETKYRTIKIFHVSNHLLSKCTHSDYVSLIFSYFVFKQFLKCLQGWTFCHDSGSKRGIKNSISKLWWRLCYHPMFYVSFLGTTSCDLFARCPVEKRNPNTQMRSASKSNVKANQVNIYFRILLKRGHHNPKIFLIFL